MTLTAYAKRRGVSVVAVSKAVRSGRLVESIARDERGIPSISDPDLADREWTERTRRRADYTPPETASGVMHPGPAPAPGQAVRVVTIPPPDDPMRNAVSVEVDKVPPYNVSQAIRAHHQARRESAIADMAELDLLERKGELIDAERARRDVQDRCSLVRTRILGVPSRLAQRLPHLAGEVVPAADELVREALEELAADGLVE